MTFGTTSGGWKQHDYYCPTIQEFSDDVAGARQAKLNPSARVPIPLGWDFDLLKSSLLIEPSAFDYARYVKAFGYVVHLNDSTSGDTPDGFTASVVLKLPFRFGSSSSEASPSWALSFILTTPVVKIRIFARINAFSGKADLSFAK